MSAETVCPHMGWDQTEYAGLYGADLGPPDRAGTADVGHGGLRTEAVIVSSSLMKASGRGYRGLVSGMLKDHLNEPDQIETRQAEAGKL